MQEHDTPSELEKLLRELLEKDDDEILSEYFYVQCNFRKSQLAFTSVRKSPLPYTFLAFFFYLRPSFYLRSFLFSFLFLIPALLSLSLSGSITFSLILFPHCSSPPIYLPFRLHLLSLFCVPSYGSVSLYLPLSSFVFL